MTGIKPDRRQVVRAGIWTVPAIAVAATAPAYATSAANLSTSTATNPSRNGRVYTGTITIKNTGQSTTAALTVTVDLALGVDADPTLHTLSGFTVTSVTTTTVTFTAISQLGAGQNIGPLTYTVRRSNSGASVSALTVNISPGGGGTPSPQFGPGGAYTL